MESSGERDISSSQTKGSGTLVIMSPMDQITSGYSSLIHLILSVVINMATGTEFDLGVQMLIGSDEDGILWDMTEK